MHSIDTLIISDIIIPVIPANTVWHNKSIAIHDGEIIDILDTDQALEKYTANNIHNLHGHAVIPGLINAHSHVPMSLFRGIADDLALFDWLQNHIWPAEAEIMCSESVHVGTQLAIAEMLLSGVTCFYDMFFFTEDIIKATEDAGMRAVLGCNVMDVPNKWAQSSAECLEKSANILKQELSPLTSLALAAQGPYTNCDTSLINIRKMADQHKLRIMIHLHETEQEIKDSIAQYGKRPLQRLDDLGFLGPDVLAVHMVHINDEDLEIINKHKLNIAHCPEANMKLGSGFANMPRLAKAGINISIGTDSVASNNDLDLIAEMRQAALLAKGITQDPTAFPAQEILAMATIKAARAMGLEDKIGSIEVGKRADITAIDLTDPQTQPLYNPVSQIVYAANRKQVANVWVDGRLLVDKHCLTNLSQKDLLEQAEQFITIAKKYQFPQLA